MKKIPHVSKRTALSVEPGRIEVRFSGAQDAVGRLFALAQALTHVDTILVQERNPDGEVLRRVIGGWLARGRAVFVVVGQQEFSFFAPDFALAAVCREP